jgi:hypothetical protein
VTFHQIYLDFCERIELLAKIENCAIIFTRGLKFIGIREFNMRALLAAAIILLGFASAPAYSAALEARVDISEQKMRVYSNGRLKYVWPVSTARKGKVTPRGTWRAKSLSKNHRSSRYNNAPMPYSIFYSGNFAIHGTNQVKRLGRPASAGCVRLHTDHARVLFNMTQRVGLRNMKVRVVQ